jgi:hypothetical protein
MEMRKEEFKANRAEAPEEKKESKKKYVCHGKGGPSPALSFQISISPFLAAILVNWAIDCTSNFSMILYL